MASRISTLIAYSRRSGIAGSCIISRAQINLRNLSTLDQLKTELTSRKLPVLYDAPTETPSRLLDVTLADFLPPSPISFPSTQPETLKNTTNPPVYTLRPGHHLVYFPPASRLSELLPDGTDPDQSPGDPFVRRMWAGGRIRFSPKNPQQLRLNGTLNACVERISNVVSKGNPGEEKIFVTIERCFTGSTNENAFTQSQSSIKRGQDDQLRKTLNEDSCSLVEYRDLVFMRERSPEAAADAAKSISRVVKPAHTPTFSHTLVPTASLLFRFSALTFNAHRIHLDRSYCRDIEGHRNLLFHGPLSLVLMLEILNRYLAQQGIKKLENGTVRPEREIEEISYRNIAPLYADEELTVCLRDRNDENFDLWIQGRDGGLAVKATATTAI
jgi:hydroxyacyl-ACP dehydratase HTD2-like protein with hotdog domain